MLFCENSKRAISILKNEKCYRMSFSQHFNSCPNSQKNHLRILEYSPGLARTQGGPRGPGSTLEQKEYISRFGAKRYTFCGNELILAKI